MNLNLNGLFATVVACLKLNMEESRIVDKLSGKYPLKREDAVAFVKAAFRVHDAMLLHVLNDR